MRLSPSARKLLNDIRADIAKMRESITGLSAVKVDIQQLISAERDEAERYRQQERERERKKSDITDRILIAERDIQEHKQRNERTYNNFHLWIQVILVAGTWLAFIAAAIYAGVTTFQLREMTRAADAAHEAAVAATNSVKQAEQTMRIDQRAWVRVFANSYQLKIGEPVYMPGVISVSGKTPARKVTGDMRLELLKPHQDPNFTYHGHPHMHLPSILITPGVDVSVNMMAVDEKLAPVIFDTTIKRQIDDGDLFLILHGQLTYDDVFGTHHWLHFCNFGALQRSAKRPPVKCDEYNEMDDNR